MWLFFTRGKIINYYSIVLHAFKLHNFYNIPFADVGKQPLPRHSDVRQMFRRVACAHYENEMKWIPFLINDGNAKCNIMHVFMYIKLYYICTNNSWVRKRDSKRNCQGHAVGRFATTNCSLFSGRSVNNNNYKSFRCSRKIIMSVVVYYFNLEYKV